MGQYFENNRELKSERKIIDIYFKEKKYNFYTDNGVFCKDKFDYGTKLLLDSIDNIKDNSRILDLGCGYGVVGVILKTLYKNISVDMVDVNLRALKLAKENLKLNNVEANVFESDVYNNIKSKYDYIITNPPIRAGKNVVRRFLVDSYQYLNNDGVLFFVMRKDHGVKSMIKELQSSYSCFILNKDKGFYIVKIIPKK